MVSGRNCTLKVHDALGASAAHGGSGRTNCRGRASERVRDLAVRLLMVN